jgi:hypothetical protein
MKLKVTLACVEREFPFLAKDILAKFPKKDCPEPLDWAYEWSRPAPRFSSRDALRALTRGRPYIPAPNLEDTQVTLLVSCGSYTARRRMPRIPREVRAELERGAW